MTEQERSERKRESQRRWRAANKDYIRRYNKWYRKQFPGKVKAAVRRWQRENPERVRELRDRWNEAHPDYHRLYNREYNKTHRDRWKKYYKYIKKGSSSK